MCVERDSRFASGNATGPIVVGGSESSPAFDSPIHSVRMRAGRTAAVVLTRLFGLSSMSPLSKLVRLWVDVNLESEVEVTATGDCI